MKGVGTMAKTQGEISLVRGEDRIVKFAIRDDEGSPVDLTACTEITATFKTKTNTFATCKLTEGDIEITSAAAGTFELTLDTTFTDALAEGQRLDFQVDLTISGKKYSLKYKQALNVDAKLG
jgi:hypothetical protein